MLLVNGNWSVSMFCMHKFVVDILTGSTITFYNKVNTCVFSDFSNIFWKASFIIIFRSTLCYSLKG
jgi:hypothetical protein